MKRSPQKFRRNRAVVFEALQARELMAGDVTMLSFEAQELKITAEQWAAQILHNSSIQWTIQNSPQGELKKFNSEQEAEKAITESFSRIWKDVLGKPVNDKLNFGYINYWQSTLPSFATLEDASLNSVRFYSADGSTNSSGIQTNSSSGLINSLGSATNNQVASVDEADRFEVSANGFVYTLAAGGDSVWNHVKVFDIHDPKNLVNVATIDVQGYAPQLHLVDNQLILVNADWTSSSPEGVTRIKVYDVSDPSKPTLQTSLTVSGANQQSRFADGKLTLFGSNWNSAMTPLFISDNPSAVYTSLTDVPIGRFESAEEYTARIQPLVVGWMLPDVKAEGSDIDLNTGDWTDLIARSVDDYRQQVSVQSFALNESGLELIDTETFLGVTMSTSYVDDNSVYFANTVAIAPAVMLEAENPSEQDPSAQNPVAQTRIYAVELGSESVDFVGSGDVPGTVRDSRMMDEYQGNLRVFSNVLSWNPGWMGQSASTNLYILKPNAGKLETIGQLEDVADGQALYSAYFDEDQAVITTWVSQVPNMRFFGNDPLHGFDLSDPTNPVELSELVIPGVSTYLQRVDATHLVGVGFIDVGSGDWRQQISLYDVSDLTDLKVVDTWTSKQTDFFPNFGGWNQDALAISFDPTSGLFSIANSAFGMFGNPGLTVIKIDVSNEDPLQFLGQVGDGKALINRSAVVGDSLLVISNIWLQTYSLQDLAVELDHALLTNPTVSDWYNVVENDTLNINLLSNDYFTDGQITAISSSSLGTVTILDDSTIQFKASAIDGPGANEQLTYTVLLKNGESYSGMVSITVFGSGYGISGPVFGNPEFGPIFSDPPPIVEPILEFPKIVEKAIAIEGDINGDGELAPQDILLLVDYLNQRSEQRVAGEALAAISASFASMDLSGDGEFSPIDIMLAVERLNANAAALLASGEGPDDTAATASDALANDEALLSLLAANTAGQEETLPAKRRR